MPLYPPQFNGASIAGNASITGNATVGGTLSLNGGSTITFGPSADTDLYRLAANSLATDDSLTVFGHALGLTQPGDIGLLAWNYDPALTSSTTTSGAGTIYLSAVYVQAATNLTGIWFVVNTAGSGATAGANNVGLYDATGTLLASVNVDSFATSNGPHKATISSTAVTPGMYWVAMQFTASGQPGIGRANPGQLATLNMGLSASQYRFATNGSGTTLPSTITPASNSTTGAAAFWVGVS